MAENRHNTAGPRLYTSTALRSHSVCPFPTLLASSKSDPHSTSSSIPVTHRWPTGWPVCHDDTDQHWSSQFLFPWPWHFLLHSCPKPLWRLGEFWLCHSHKGPSSLTVWALALDLQGEFPWNAWPPGCTLTFLFKAVLGRAWSLSASFVLACDTTGCQSLSLTGRTGQNELAALQSRAEFILVPLGSTVWTC